MDQEKDLLKQDLAKQENPEEIKKFIEDVELMGENEDIVELAKKKLEEILAKVNTVEKTSESQISQVESMGGAGEEVTERTQEVDQKIKEVKTQTQEKITEVQNENQEEVKTETQEKPVELTKKQEYKVTENKIMKEVNSLLENEYKRLVTLSSKLYSNKELPMDDLNVIFKEEASNFSNFYDSLFKEGSHLKYSFNKEDGYDEEKLNNLIIEKQKNSPASEKFGEIMKFLREKLDTKS